MKEWMNAIVEKKIVIRDSSVDIQYYDNIFISFGSSLKQESRSKTKIVAYNFQEWKTKNLKPNQKIYYEYITELFLGSLLIQAVSSQFFLVAKKSILPQGQRQV